MRLRLVEKRFAMLDIRQATPEMSAQTRMKLPIQRSLLFPVSEQNWNEFIWCSHGGDYEE
jgi:hypothetical protein